MSKLKAHAERLKKLEGLTVETGWFASNLYPDGTPVAAVAMANEFGLNGAPARPFMRKAHSEAQPILPAAVEKAARLVVTSDNGEQALGATVGAVFEREIVKSIKSKEWAPLSPETISRKGFATPLIDTAVMWQSVTTKITKQGD